MSSMDSILVLSRDRRPQDKSMEKKEDGVHPGIVVYTCNTRFTGNRPLSRRIQSWVHAGPYRTIPTRHSTPVWARGYDRRRRSTLPIKDHKILNFDENSQYSDFRFKKKKLILISGLGYSPSHPTVVQRNRPPYFAFPLLLILVSPPTT